jgi:hypothetical protein
MPFAYRAVGCRVARQGVEPRLTDSKSVVLSITLAGRVVKSVSFSRSVQARSRTWSSTFAGSRAHPSHSKDVKRVFVQ